MNYSLTYDQDHIGEDGLHPDVYTPIKYWKIDEWGNDYEEGGCSVCHTRYKVPRLEPFRLPAFYPDKFIERVLSNIKQEGERMNDAELKEYAKLVEEYERTNTCAKHLWVDSNPVVTSEGKFVFKSCVVCHLAYAVYKGQKYTAQLEDLVRWVAHNGIENEKVKKADPFSSLGKVEPKADSSLASLFVADSLPALDFVGYDEPLGFI